MQIAKVIGTVVCTRKEDTLTGYRLLVLEVQNPEPELPENALPLQREDRGVERLVAIDMLGAGITDLVLFVRGGAARVNLPTPAPVDATVVGIIDSVDVEL